MHRRRIILAVLLLALAVAIGIAGAVIELRPHDHSVLIDRSVLDRIKDKPQAVVPDTELKAGQEAQSLALRPAPDVRFVDKTPTGLLPRKAETGEHPSEFYARPFDPSRLAPDRPKLALVLMQSGISETLTAEAYLALPSDVSFVLSPYAQDAERQMRDIRNRGHEVFLGISSVVDADQREDRGPHALDPAKSRDENREHLLWAMSRFTGYVGIVGDMTEQAYQNAELRHVIDSETTSRGVTRLVVTRRNSRTFDQFPDRLAMTGPAVKFYLSGHRPDELQSSLQRLLPLLKDTNRTIVFVEPGPLAIDVVKLWLQTHQSRAFDLMPLSALMHSEEQG